MLLTNSITQDCGYSIGGIQKLLLTNYQDIKDYIFYSDSTRNTVSGYSFTPELNPFVWYEFDVDRNQVTFNEEMGISLNGKSYNQSITMQFDKLDAGKRTVIKELNKGGFICIFKDFNDKWWIFGLERPLRNTQYQAKTDVFQGANGYNLTLSTVSLYPIREIDVNFVRNYITFDTITTVSSTDPFYPGDDVFPELQDATAFDKAILFLPQADEDILTFS